MAGTLCIRAICVIRGSMKLRNLGSCAFLLRPGAGCEATAKAFELESGKRKAVVLGGRVLQSDALRRRGQRPAGLNVAGYSEAGGQAAGRGGGRWAGAFCNRTRCAAGVNGRVFFCAEGATYVRPRATPWRKWSSSNEQPCKGAISRTGTQCLALAGLEIYSIETQGVALG